MIPCFPSPPLGSTLDRYLLALFARGFAAALAVVVLMHMMGDIFNRIDNLMGSGAAFSTAVAYFIHRLPLLISRGTGFAALFAAFLVLGSLSRRHELVAIRACGLSLHRVTVPLLLAALGISVATFLWNETAVPFSTSKAKHIYDVKVRKKQLQSVFGNKEIWMRSNGAFLRADDFDTERNRLHGLVIYRLTPEFRLDGVVEVPAANWDGTRWIPEGGTEWRLLAGGTVSRQSVGTALSLEERPDDFRIFARSPDEFGYFDLKARIDDLRVKGVDAVRDTVSLHTKVAIPLVIPLTILLAVALASKPGRKDNLVLNFGLAVAIGFAYWVLLGFCVSLGKAGAMPPWLAAWSPNMLVGVASLYFYTGSE